MISSLKMSSSKISQVWLATMTFLRTYVVWLNLVWSFKRRIIIINNLRTSESSKYFFNVLSILSILYKIQIIISVWLLLIVTFFGDRSGSLGFLGRSRTFDNPFDLSPAAIYNSSSYSSSSNRQH